MKHTNISQDIIDIAKEKADAMGIINNSITSGKGSTHGFLGEIIVSNFLGATIENTYDYDLRLQSFTIDVKTKRVNTPPRPNYECSIAAFNTKQACNFYVFTRILNNMGEGWILGYLPKEEYFDRAVFLKKGETDPSNGWTVSADCYNLPIKELKNIEDLKNEKVWPVAV